MEVVPTSVKIPIFTLYLEILSELQFHTLEYAIQSSHFNRIDSLPNTGTFRAKDCLQALLQLGL